MARPAACWAPFIAVPVARHLSTLSPTGRVAEQPIRPFALRRSTQSAAQRLQVVDSRQPVPDPTSCSAS